VRGLAVSVNIGAKLLPSLNSTASGVERRFGQMGRKLKIVAAETKAAWREMSAAMSPLAAMAAAGGLAMTLKGAIGAGAEYQHQISVMKNMGRTAKEMSEAIRAAHRTAFEVPTSTWTDNLKTFNETVMAFGSVAHATENMPFVQKMNAMFNNALGDGHGLDKESGYSLIKALEMRGMGTKSHPGFDSARFRKEASFFAQASIASGGKVSPEELFNFTKKASPFVQGLSDRFMWRIAPTLVQESGGDIAGTQLSTWMGTILGKAKNKISTEAWMKLGLLDPKQVVYNKVGPVGWRPGAIKGTDLAMSDPLAWSEKVLLPALRAHGIDTGNVLSMQKALMPLFRDRNSNRMEVALASAQTNANLHKDERLIGKVPGVESGYAAMLENDPLAAGKALRAAGTNLKTALGNALYTAGAVSAINNLARGINWMAEAFDRHPNFARGIDALMGLGLIAATLRTFNVAVRWAFAPLSGLMRLLGASLWRALGPMMFRGILSAGTFITQGFLALAPVIGEGLVSAFALISNPVGWAVLAGLAIAAAGAFVWHFRKQIGGFLSRSWTAIKNAFLAVPWANIGMAIADALTLGLASKLPAIGGALQSWWQSIAPTALGGKPVAKAPIAGHRRYGGPVQAGRRYVVGEAGEEEFVAGQSGVIVPHSELVRRRSARAAAAPPIEIHIHGAHDPHAVAREVERVLKRYADGQAALLSD
jgi:hypothetical protein